VQGVHRVKERLSVEEPEQRSARSAGRISFEEILRSEFVEIPGMQGVHGRSKSSKESSSEGIARRNIQRSEALKVSRIIGQDPSRRERDHSRSLDLGKGA
jgi:hypothetical protein